VFSAAFNQTGKKVTEVELGEYSTGLIASKVIRIMG